MSRFPVPSRAELALCAMAILATAVWPRVLAAQACTVSGVTGAQCLAVTVPENRAEPAGRALRLRAIILPARATPKRAEPIVFLAGGPGQAASSLADFAANTLGPALADRDVVLLDQRGTGESNPLRCALYGDGSRAAPFYGDLLPDAAVRACRAALDRTADPRQYTTADAVQDLEALRVAIGAEQVWLYGTSYGTRVAFEYMREHPDRVRGAVLKGVAPPGFLTPLSYPRDAQAALDAMFDACDADAACRGAYPQARQTFAGMRERLEAGSTVELPGATGAAETITLRWDGVAAALIGLLQSPAGAAQIPLLFHLAAQGQIAPLATLVRDYRRNLTEQLSLGMFLSVTCAEDLPFITAADAAREAQGTFLGQIRFQEQRDACAAWPVPRADAQMREPVASNAPVLLISGALDPVTPPRHAERAMPTLPNAVHVVVTNASHSFNGMGGCVENIIGAFLRTDSVPAAERACIARIVRPPFALPRTPHS